MVIPLLANQDLTPMLLWYSYEITVLDIVEFQDQIYSCGGAYIYIDVPSEEALPLCPKCPQAIPGCNNAREGIFSTLDYVMAKLAIIYQLQWM